MTLKFLASMVTDTQDEDAHNVITAFWEAVTCNVDGMLELGIEMKVRLLMHLLSQATVQKVEIDERIPNKKQILNIIEIVVLKDLLSSADQLKESGYMTQSIKQGLMKIVDEGDSD